MSGAGHCIITAKEKIVWASGDGEGRQRKSMVEGDVGEIG